MIKMLSERIFGAAHRGAATGYGRPPEQRESLRVHAGTAEQPHMAGTERQRLIDILQLVGIVRLAGGRRNPPGGPAKKADKLNRGLPLPSCCARS